MVFPPLILNLDNGFGRELLLASVVSGGVAVGQFPSFLREFSPWPCLVEGGWVEGVFFRGMIA